MTVYAYSRVSTDDQTTDNQILEVVQAGYQVAPECCFADVGVSGSVPASERPQWAVMLPKMVAGDVLVVSKIERTKAGLERAKAEGQTLGAKPKDRDEVYELFTKGTSNSEISRITGISRPTLIKWRKEWEEQQASD